ncbi:MAG TPA: Rieske 2Fe-2S domain-containing protein, partial [Planctomycetota bacterium]|nr:Rieske 2Fe-2S domain-containing protein [Planctomycetota bacterium]
ALTDRPPSPEMSRRDLFLKTGWLGFLAFSAFMGGCFARYFFPRVLFEPPSQFKAGYPNEYTVGEVSTKYKDTNRVWIVRESTGFYAIFARCTHLGCTPMWLDGEQKFKCPCHGSGYTKEGINYEGPAPRPMERCKITIADDGQLLVDTATRFRYEEGQWDKNGAYLRV